MYHDAILGKLISDTNSKDTNSKDTNSKDTVSKEGKKDHEENKVFKGYLKRRGNEVCEKLKNGTPTDLRRILYEEMNSACILAHKLHRMTLWVWFSLYLLIAAVVLLAITLTFSNILPSQDEKCAMDPTQFNVTHAHAWQCSKFNKGSLAEQCANDPSQYHVDKAGCLQFIPPTNPTD